MQKSFGISLCNNIAHCLLCALACRTDSYLLNKSMKVFLLYCLSAEKQKMHSAKVLIR